MPKVPYPYEVNGKLIAGNGSLIPICSLNIKPFLIVKFDCRWIFYVWNDFTFKKLHNPTYQVIISYMYSMRYELMKTELFNSMYVPICMSDRSKAIGYIILIG